MKNYEKYADEIKGYDGFNFCRDFVKPRILKPRGCANTNCDQCKMLQMLWLMEEYEEPEIDWGQVEVDTPILVRDSEDEDWERRYFAEVKWGTVYAWKDGCTSWTTHCMTTCMTAWTFAKLAEDEKKCEESETDWSKVEVDTPILVRDAKYRRWVKRYFAKYNNGTIFAWTIGCTSRDAHNMMTPWKYAKLAENEETK